MRRKITSSRHPKLVASTSNSSLSETTDKNSTNEITKNYSASNETPENVTGDSKHNVSERGSKRKSIIPRKTLSAPENEVETPVNSVPETSVKRKSTKPRKISRAIKEENVTDVFEKVLVKSEPIIGNEQEEQVEEVEEDKSKRRKRKRPAGRIRKTLYLDESSDNEDTAHLIVTCAICKEEMEKIYWVKHKLKHNNLCWRLGYPEIDLTNEKLVLSILHKLAHIQKQPLLCEQCGVSKKSVAGYLSHKTQCGKDKKEILALRMPCPVCGRLMQPSSLKVHMSVHSSVRSPSDENISLGEPDEDGKIRRPAAKRAAGFIQEVTEDDTDTGGVSYLKAYKKGSDKRKSVVSGGLLRSFQKTLEENGVIHCPIRNCGFKATDEKTICNHVKTCEKIYPEDYVCRYCLFLAPTEAEIRKHAKAAHLKLNDNNYSIPKEEDSEDNEDSQNLIKNKRVFSQKNTFYKFDFLTREKRVLPSIVCTYPAAFNWTLQYRQANDSQNLYPEFRCPKTEWIIILKTEKEMYLPEIKKSMFVKHLCIEDNIPNLQGEEHMWEFYQLFDSIVAKDCATMFCGGPIWALAWVPTPLDQICDQYLAVSIHKNPDDMYKISKAYTSNEIIQFWNCGELLNEKKLFHPPNLEFCLAHNHGMVWHMEWCPSGCYDDFDPEEKYLKRLGMLALACSDGYIVIYTICFSDNLPDHPVPKVYKTKETFKLIMENYMEQNLGLWNYQATKVHWSKGKGHNIIAGGYSNGIVALFDLNNTSPLLRFEENGIIILKPYHIFQAHVAPITVLSFHIIDDGKRWLLTGSWDRSNKFWDVEDTSSYITTHNKRSLITDGLWMNNWLSTYISYDDVFSLAHTVTTVQNVRDFCYKQSSALATNSMITSISGSDWANAVLQVNLAGEISASFPQQMFVSYDGDKSLKCKRVILGYSELIEMGIEPSEREKKMKKKEKQSNMDFSDKDDKFIIKYLMNKDTEEFDEEPDTYKEAQEKYGLIFCDFKLDSFSYIPKEALAWTRQSGRMKVAPLELYPLESINKVQWNPNKQAFLYLATGYHAGFVRIKCVRFMNTKLPEF